MKVLVPLDGSDISLSIVPAVRRLLDVAPGTEVHLLTVLDPRRAHGSTEQPIDEAAPTVLSTRGPTVSSPFPRVVETHGEAMDRMHTEAVDALRTAARTHFPAATVVVHTSWSNKPAEAICEQARELEVDLVAMSTHGRSGLSHALAGSVAEGVIRGVGRSVLVVAPDRK